MLSELQHQSAMGRPMENNPNEVELPFPRIEYQSALIKANIAIGLTFLQIGNLGVHGLPECGLIGAHGTGPIRTGLWIAGAE